MLSSICQRRDHTDRPSSQMESPKFSLHLSESSDITEMNSFIFSCSPSCKYRKINYSNSDLDFKYHRQIFYSSFFLSLFFPSMKELSLLTHWRSCLPFTIWENVQHDRHILYNIRLVKLLSLPIKNPQIYFSSSEFSTVSSTLFWISASQFDPSVKWKVYSDTSSCNL